MAMKFSLLHADKDTEMLKTLPRLFPKKHMIFTATSAAECREILKEHDIHLLILDQSIVGKSGNDILEEVLLGYQKTVKILTGAKKNVDFLIHAMNSERSRIADSRTCRGRLHSATIYSVYPPSLWIQLFPRQIALQTRKQVKLE